MGLICAPLFAVDSWNIYVYMAADNNLASYAIKDLNSMESALKPANLNVFVQTDLPATHTLSGTRRWKVSNDNTEAIVSQQLEWLGSQNSGDPQTLRSFVQWGLSRPAAERNMLIIWSHGDSWYKGFDSKWICSDDSAEQLISVADGELRCALTGFPKFDAILLDACSMQTIEVLTELKDIADYIVASEDLVPVNGFPYDDILPLFDGEISDILEAIPSLYTASYAANGSQNPFSQDLPTTCSVIKTAPLNVFIQNLGLFAVENKQNAGEILRLRQDCFGMNTGLAEIDIGELLSLISQNSTIPSLSLDANALLGDWQDCVIASSVIGYQHPVGTAVIWFPDIKLFFDNAWQHYNKLLFANTYWLSLLNLAWGDDVTSPISPPTLEIRQVLKRINISFIAVPDPDSITYRIRISQGLEQQDYYFSPPRDVDKPVFTANVSQSGSVQIWSIDTAGNISENYAQSSYILNESNDKLIVYPNPADKSAAIAMSWSCADFTEGELILELYNIRGQRVMSKLLSASENGFAVLSAYPELSHIASGNYFVVLRQGHKSLSARVNLR